MRIPDLTIELLRKMEPMTARMYMVTPEMAAYLIEHNDNFRSASDVTIRRFSYDVQSDNWKKNYSDNITVQAVGDDFTMFNGQHRILTILKTGLPMPLMIAMAPKNEKVDIGAIDRGRMRTPAQYLNHVTGISDSRVAAAISVLLKDQHVHRSVVTNAMYLAGYLQYQEPLDFIVANSPQHKIGIKSEIIAATIRAWYNTEDKQRCIDFLEQVSTGQHSGPEDDAARMLRNILITRGMGFNRNFSRRCEMLVGYFIRGKSPPAKGINKVIKEAGSVLPIPAFRFEGLDLTHGKDDSAYRPKPDTLAELIYLILKQNQATWFNVEELLTEAKKRGYKGSTTHAMSALMLDLRKRDGAKWFSSMMKSQKKLYRFRAPGDAA